MDITVKFAGVVHSNESMNDFDRVAGVFSILTSQDVLSKRRLTQHQINTVNDSLEYFAVGGYTPMLSLRDGYVTTESLSDAWGWVVEKISGVGAAISAKLSAIKLWWDRLGFSIGQYKSRLKRISNKLESGQEIKTGNISLKNFRYPEMFFNDNGEIRERIKQLERFTQSTNEYVTRFAVPYFRKGIRSYSMARNVDLKSQRDFEYALEFLVDSYPDAQEYGKFLDNISLDYAGFFSLEYVPEKRHTGNWTERLVSIGKVPLKIKAPDEATRNRLRIESRRAIIDPTYAEEITMMRDFLEANLDGLHASEKDLFMTVMQTYEELRETASIIEQRIRVYQHVIQETPDTTVIIRQQDPTDAGNATKLIELLNGFYNETSQFYEIGESMGNMCSFYIDAYLRLAEEALSI